MGGLVALSRANILGHVSVLEHLAGAALENQATRPIGSATSQLLRFTKVTDAIRKKAVYEGGWGGEMASAKGFINAWRPLIEKLKSGKSAIDWLHDKGKIYPKSFLDFVGNVHGAIKEPVRQGIYARAMELGTKAAEEQGLNPARDEVLRDAISAEAYRMANEDIFVGDNFLTRAVHKSVTGVLRGEKLDSGAARFIADIIDIMFPVVNVPINIAIRKFRLVAGLPEFGIRLAHHAARGELANGAKTLSARDAEQIVRAFKYGVTGAALAAYAWTHADQFGGIYAPGQNAPRDKKTGLKPGEIALPKNPFFDHISHHIAHGPWGATMNMIADARRTYDKQVKGHPENKWNALGEAGFFALFAGAKDLPAMSTIGRLTSPYHSAAQKAGEIVKNIVLFGALQDLAEATDSKKRAPKTFIDEIKSGIPGLRQTVPEAKK